MRPRQAWTCPVSPRRVWIWGVAPRCGRSTRWMHSPNDTCYFQHTSETYSKQVMPATFRAFGAREVPTDDTMILLDVLGSMDFEPLGPDYNKYLIAGYIRSN